VDSKEVGNDVVYESDVTNGYSRVLSEIECTDSRDVIIIDKDDVTENNIEVTDMVEMKIMRITDAEGQEEHNVDLTGSWTYEENTGGDNTTKMVNVVKLLWKYGGRNLEEVRRGESQVNDPKDPILYSQRDAITWES
jgi:hypothetical protein